MRSFQRLRTLSLQSFAPPLGFIANALVFTNFFNHISSYKDASGCCRWYLFSKWINSFSHRQKHYNLLEPYFEFFFVPPLYSRLELLINWFVIYNCRVLLRTPSTSYLKLLCSTLCLRHLARIFSLSEIKVLGCRSGGKTHALARLRKRGT